eukprot:scaffold290534_cov20-Prasinocladus_malaysianus.AAC.1
MPKSTIYSETCSTKWFTSTSCDAKGAAPKKRKPMHIALDIPAKRHTGEGCCSQPRNQSMWPFCRNRAGQRSDHSDQIKLWKEERPAENPGGIFAHKTACGRLPADCCYTTKTKSNFILYC